MSRLEGPRGSSLYGTHHPIRKEPFQTCCTSAGARESPVPLKHGSAVQIHYHYESRIETTVAFEFSEREMRYAFLYVVKSQRPSWKKIWSHISGRMWTTIRFAIPEKKVRLPCPGYKSYIYINQSDPSSCLPNHLFAFVTLVPVLFVFKQPRGKFWVL